ncbi:auxin-responsive protein SAUR50-like [Nicotiana tomentosiformis]|uniref:auxin-responsive protein SAUR50-like n=1 Tax=Nicotiana tomentosiformis TaxID=4098 RepID=UPI00051AC968|nr:auxin-responsive protein SAUR50-like [Nicotiana tomentosiformis]
MFKIIGEEIRSKGLITLKLLIKKLIKNIIKSHLQFSPRRENGVEFVKFPRVNNEEVVPDDVKEGHFAVFAVNTGSEETRKRFILELNWLTNPAFLRLLKLAEEEYGFRQKGVLEIPCPPEELEKIILQLKIERN